MNISTTAAAARRVGGVQDVVTMGDTAVAVIGAHMCAAMRGIEALQAEQIIGTGQADFVALARAMLYDPRWPWHAAAALGATVSTPAPYWRSQPHGLSGLFGPEARIGAR